MATMNANESRAMDNYQFDFRQRKDAIGKDNYRGKENNTKSDGGFKPRYSSYQAGDQKQKYNSNDRYMNSGNKARDNNNNNQAGDYNSQSRDNGNKGYKKQIKPYGEKSTDTRYHNSMPYRKNFFDDKDEEVEHKSSRSQRTSEVKAKIPQDQPLDKLEAFNRLEREKKAMQKKLREEEIEKKRRPTPKQRRSSKSTLTKEYIYGLYDDEEYY